MSKIIFNLEKKEKIVNFDYEEFKRQALGARKIITYQPDGLAAHPLCGSNAVHFHAFSSVKINNTATTQP